MRQKHTSSKPLEPSGFGIKYVSLLKFWEGVQKYISGNGNGFYQFPLLLTELFQHSLINVSYLTACYLYQVMMTLHFLNDVANDAKSTRKSIKAPQACNIPRHGIFSMQRKSF